MAYENVAWTFGGNLSGVTSANAYLPATGCTRTWMLSRLSDVSGDAGKSSIRKIASSGRAWRTTIVRPAATANVTAVSGTDAPDASRSHTLSSVVAGAAETADEAGLADSLALLP